MSQFDLPMFGPIAALLAGGAAATGAFALLHGSPLAIQTPAAVTNPVLFGSLLCGWTILRFLKSARSVTSPQQVRATASQVSRGVYLFLYLLAALKLLVHAENGIMQAHLISGVVAIALVRALAALYGRSPWWPSESAPRLQARSPLSSAVDDFQATHDDQGPRGSSPGTIALGR